jgi:SPP1 family predicted phage head-tail adaptor
MITAGRLRHRLTIEAAVTEDDGSGGFTTSWVEVATIWGAIEAITGGEFTESDAIKAEATYRIVIRYRENISPAHRLRFYARVFEIKSVIDPEGLRRRLVCYCVERG